jgi:uncharacterized Zn finger protein (UPF0148 family)
VMPKSQYRCQKCKFKFERDKPGQVMCPACGHIYVDWINYEKVLAWLYANDPDFRNYK